MPVQALPEAPGWGMLFRSREICAFQGCWIQRPEQSDTMSDPAVILGRYRCSSHHGNVGSKTSQGTVTCPQTFDLLLIP